LEGPSILTRIESQDGPGSNGILLAGDGLLFPLNNAIVSNFFRRNTTNIFIAGARRTLIGVDKLVLNALEGKIGPAGHVFLVNAGNVMSADGERTDIVLSVGNPTGQAINSASPSFAQPSDTLIKQNTILANGPCDANRGCAIRLMAGVTVNVDATLNEWGVTDPSEIRSGIWDKFRNPALGQVVTYCAVGQATATPSPCGQPTSVPTTPTPVPFAAPPLAAPTTPTPLAISTPPPPAFPAVATPTPPVGAPPPPTAYIDPATGHYYTQITVCVTGANNQSVSNDRLVMTLQDANGGTLGVVQATTDANGCFSGNVAATGGAAEVAPHTVSIADPSGAVTNLNIQTGSPLYRSPSGSVIPAGGVSG
jgi:hypothetical protein